MPWFQILQLNTHTLTLTHTNQVYRGPRRTGSFRFSIYHKASPIKNPPKANSITETSPKITERRSSTVSYLQRKLLHNVSQPFLEAKAQSYSQRSGAQRHAQRTKADFCGSFLLIRAWPGSRVGPEWGINTFLPKQGTLVFKWGTGPQWGTSWPALNLTPSFHRLPGKCSYRGTSESKRTFDMTFFFLLLQKTFFSRSAGRCFQLVSLLKSVQMLMSK